MQTQGHSESHGGLRGHSIGPLYPFMVIGLGMSDWAVQHPNGAISKRYKEIDKAYMLATVLKEDLQDGIYEAPNYRSR